MTLEHQLSLAFERGLDDLEVGLAEVLRLLSQVRAAKDTQGELRVMKVYCTLLSMSRRSSRPSTAESRQLKSTEQPPDGR
jgi:hypothetical protein